MIATYCLFYIILTKNLSFILNINLTVLYMLVYLFFILFFFIFFIFIVAIKKVLHIINCITNFWFYGLKNRFWRASRRICKSNSIFRFYKSVFQLIWWDLMISDLEFELVQRCKPEFINKKFKKGKYIQFIIILYCKWTTMQKFVVIKIEM